MKGIRRSGAPVFSCVSRGCGKSVLLVAGFSWHGFSSRGRRRLQDPVGVRRGKIKLRRGEQALLLLKNRNASAMRVGVSTLVPVAGQAASYARVANPCHGEEACTGCAPENAKGAASPSRIGHPDPITAGAPHQKGRSEVAAAGPAGIAAATEVGPTATAAEVCPAPAEVRATPAAEIGTGAGGPEVGAAGREAGVGA